MTIYNHLTCLVFLGGLRKLILQATLQVTKLSLFVWILLFSFFTEAMASTPVQPLSVTATSTQVRGATVSLTWPASSSTDVIRYEVTRTNLATSGSTVATTVSLDSQVRALSFVDSGVVVGNSYIYNVRACNSVTTFIAPCPSCGFSTCSSWTASPKVSVAPMTPSTISAAAVLPMGNSVADIIINWTQPVGATKYEIQRTSLSSTTPVLFTSTGASFTNTSLPLGDTYTYKVRACVTATIFTPPACSGCGPGNFTSSNVCSPWGNAPGVILAQSLPVPTGTEYAKLCDSEIGVTVPDFDCDKGTLVPTTLNGTTLSAPTTSNTFTQPTTCDRPNVLNGACDPGSKFQVLTNTPEAYVVAHCRRKGSIPSAFGDIAVIQHNKKTGATCFYQSPLFSQHTIVNNIVKAPRVDASFLRPQTGGCMTCHDNGALIRSPYLTQLKTGKDVLPGAGDFTFNRATQPYFIVGHESDLTSYAVNVPNNGCISCHTLSIYSNGTSFDKNSATALAHKSTMEFQWSKAPTSALAPMWMSFSGPGSTAYDANAEAAAQAIENCANTFTNPSAIVNTANCSLIKKKGSNRGSVSFVSATSKCLDFDSPTLSLTSKNCRPSTANQLWFYNPSSSHTLSSQGKCLSASGTTVMASACDGSTQQMWTYDGLTGQLSNDASPASGKLCMQSNLNGGSIQLVGCDTTNTVILQKWAIQTMNYQSITNFVDATKVLNVEPGVITASNVASSVVSANWYLERVNGFYRIGNKVRPGEFLNTRSGSLAFGIAAPDDNSAMWIIRNRPEKGQDVYTIQSKIDPTRYINFNNGLLQSSVVSDSDAGARWKFANTPTP